jgi:predicted alpha/beta hydrolase family esterase
MRIFSALVAQPVLLVHSSGPQGPGEGSAPFAARLGEELGAGYEVLFPILPDPQDPHYAPWSERLGELLTEIEDPVVVVGHSLGGSVVLKHLSEGGHEGTITGLVLVATPFWGKREWEAEWALPEGWPDATSELPPTFLFHSRDDDEAPFAHLELYARRLHGATATPLDGNGHLFDRGDLTEVVEAIRGLAVP